MAWQTDGLEIFRVFTSPDGAHWAASAENDDGELNVYNGERGPTFEKTMNPQFVPDGIVYVAKNGKEARVVANGASEESFSRVSQLTTGAGLYAYLGKNKQGFAAVINGETVGTFEDAGDFSLTERGALFWASMVGVKGVDSKYKNKQVIFRNGEIVAVGQNLSAPNVLSDGKLLYVDCAKKWAVKEDDTIQHEHDWVVAPVLNAGGSAYVHAGRQKDAWSVFHGDQTFGTYDDVTKLAISEDGSQCAYIASVDGELAAYVNGKKGESFTSVSTVSVTDGGRVAVVHRRDDGLSITLDDTLFGPFENLGLVTIAGESFAFFGDDGDGAQLYVDGVARSDRFESMSNPVWVDGSLVVHTHADDEIARFEYKP